jgi:hypothetical protein
MIEQDEFFFDGVLSGHVETLDIFYQLNYKWS